MTDFTFSIGQLRAAPPEVRHWFAAEIARALGAIETPHPEPSHPEQTMPAACTEEEALQIFESIRNDALATRLFFELARDTATGSGLSGLHALRIADLLHHAGLPEQESLSGGLSLIDRAYREIRGDNAGSLFAFDQAGHIFIHETTRLSIRRLWHQLVAARAAAERQVPAEVAPQSGSFVPPRVGPSEDVATHLTQPLDPRRRPF